MPVTFIGVRHHSPACARLVERTIEALRPAYVLVEGPADVNDRLDELLLGHELPIAIFSHYRDDERSHLSWAPFCAYSPEWVALTVGRAHGAELRFIDLPAWHPALAGRRNRYADAEQRYADVADRLCRAFAVDNVDALWDRLVEVEPDDGLDERLATYFDLVRGDTEAGEDDTAREAYMAAWVRAAAAAAGDRPVVVVTGGFHRPALRRLVAEPGGDEAGGGWPEIPRPAAGAVAGSYLVPYSFRRLDAFSGYQSGMPSPEYYQRLWEQGADAAADGLVEAVATRLRRRGVAVSTADLIAARTLSAGLARLRGHPHPARTDILDGLVSALVSDDLDQPLPWTRRGALASGAHPVVAEMVAALSGDRTGRLHPDTPAPPLVHAVEAELTRLGLDRTGTVELDLSDGGDLIRARVLHRLRVLGIPGYTRVSGPASGADPVLDERWELTDHEARTPALIEAGAYGGTLRDAATAVLAEGVAAAGTDPGALAALLFDAALCGVTDLSEQITELIAANIAGARELGPLGEALATVLGLWRHDRVLGTAGSPMYAAVIDGAVTRVLWLAEGVHGGPAPADLARLRAVTATRDALLHAHEVLSTGRDAALDVMARIGADRDAPPDLRGAAFGFGWSLGASVDPVRALRGAAGADTLGDWLAGLFALARDEVLAAGRSAGVGWSGEAGRSAGVGWSGKAGGSAGGDGAGDAEGGVLAVLDDLITTMPDFLAGLPALRQAFAYFPPRERELIARRLLERRRLTGSARALLRTTADPPLIAEAKALEDRAGRLLAGEGLLP
ncbi:DUF5682 family protein [Actinoallomurus sp. NBC_01490]|uniref:DUF5682 family protein n=1 Tax=Actinoallomurus sp. NBC_01490 TaxID=2903557 RepID=UPI002E2F899D|nr:DUF5682 family protein [Actinoallomurus sp. NBC_01490]